MLANNSDYNQRVQQGKRIEGKIINALKQMGYRIDSASAYEDMNEKIDGWWIDKKDNRYPFQIKYRETGDDIIFEIIQDVAKQNMGRDMKSKAVLYIVADTFGRTRMFLTKPIKEKAEEVLEKIKRDQQKNPYKLDFRGEVASKVSI